MNIRKYLVIILVSLTLIPLELTWTRIFSAEFFYTFAFLVLSLAILGLGLGALSLRLIPRLDHLKFIGFYLLLSGLCAVLGPILVFKLSPDFSLLFSSWAVRGKLLLTVIILMSSYYFGGIALALLFKRYHEDMPRLYMADLIGAGVGVILAIWAMNLFGTSIAAFLTALPILAASFLVSPGKTRLVLLVPVAGIFLLLPRAGDLLELEREERAPVIYKHWDAMSKLKVYDFGGGFRGINIDNVANSPVPQFDGNWDDVSPGEIPWGINVSFLIQQFDSCVFLSLGAGGGSDVLQALVEGATEVHAVEINPHINEMMINGDPDGYLPIVPAEDSLADSTASMDSTITDDSSKTADTTSQIVTLAEFSGHIYRDPRVKVVSEDARAYVRRFENKFDIIYSLSSNTWAALASGSFALAESYLFTTEAFIDYWRALSENGFLMMEHQIYVPRLVSEVLEALEQLGVEDPLSHLAVYNLPQMRRKIILLSKRPLTEQIRYSALGELTPEKFQLIHLLYPVSDDSLKGNLINRIVGEGWQAVADTAPVDISPVSDNRPFVAQMGLWRNFSGDKLERIIPYAEFYGFPLSGVILLIILGVVIVLVVPLNLLPYLKKGPKLRAGPWLYFFAIGLAFMAVEVILIQKYALLIGSSLYSIATVLMALLVASGIGSRFSNKVSDSLAFIFIIVWLLLDAFVFTSVIEATGHYSLVPRMLITSLLIFPLGFFMGMPFPKGTLRVKKLIDWGFAVNGAASVLGSVLILLLVFNRGFAMGLTAAAVMYFLAFVLLNIRKAW